MKLKKEPQPKLKKEPNKIKPPKKKKKTLVKKISPPSFKFIINIILKKGTLIEEENFDYAAEVMGLAAIKYFDLR